MIFEHDFVIVFGLSQISMDDLDAFSLQWGAVFYIPHFGLGRSR